jgi:hypothetical protein
MILLHPEKAHIDERLPADAVVEKGIVRLHVGAYPFTSSI